MNLSIEDIFEIHNIAYEVLEFVYNKEFKKSEDFSDLYRLM